MLNCTHWAYYKFTSPGYHGPWWFSVRQLTSQSHWFWLYSLRHEHLESVSEAHLTTDRDTGAFSSSSADSSLSETRLQNARPFTVPYSGGSFTCALTFWLAPCDAQRRRRGPKEKRRNRPSRKRPWSPRRSRQKQNNPNQRETRWQASGLSQQRGAGRRMARRGRQSRNLWMGVMKALQCRMVRPLKCLIPMQDNPATSVLRQMRLWGYRFILLLFYYSGHKITAKCSQTQKNKCFFQTFRMQMTSI